MQVDDGAKAAPEKFLNDGDDWLTIIEGSQKEIPQDHWGIGASIKVRLDGDRLVISADEPGYGAHMVVRIPALTDRAVPEPDADAVERAAKAITSIWNKPTSNPTAFPASAESLARAALQAAAVPTVQAADAIYRERNQVVAALSKCFYSWIGTVDDAEPGWTKAVYIDLPSGQASWHIPDHEIPDLFGHLQESGEPWDGHTTEEKYERLAAMPAVPTEEPDMTLVYMKGYQDGQDAAGDDLDAMLDSVHPGCCISYVLEEGNHWRCFIRWPVSVGKRSILYRDAMGTGATRMEAILNAVKSAKEATP